MKHVLASGGLLAVIAHLVRLCRAQQAECSFAPHGDLFMENDQGEPQRISAGILCPFEALDRCTAYGGGHVRGYRYLNVSTASDESEDGIFDAVEAATALTFAESASLDTGNYTMTVSPGSFGYLGFLGVYECQSGVMQGGCVDGVEEQPLKACRPNTVDDHTGFNGTAGFVRVEGEVARNMTTNPAAVQGGDSENEDQDGKGEEEEDNEGREQGEGKAGSTFSVSSHWLILVLAISCFRNSGI